MDAGRTTTPPMAHRRRLCSVAIALTLCLLANATHAGEWVQRNVVVPPPTGMPPSFTWEPHFLELAFDAARNVTVGVGGRATNGVIGLLPVSEYNGSSWISRYNSPDPRPSNRSSPGVVYDSRRHVTVVFGGADQTSLQAQNDLWEWDGVAWTERTWTGPGPAPTIYAPIAFDPVRGRTIILANSATAGRWETWEWTGSAWDRGPDLIGVNTGSLTTMVFDTDRNRGFLYTTLYGGNFERTFEYIPGTTAAQGTWQNVPINDFEYEAKTGVAMIYDPYFKRVIRHGGKAVTALYGYGNATRVWDAGQSRWSIIAFLPDQGRAGAHACFDLSRVRVVLYGGIRVYVDFEGVGRTQYYTDTWEYVDELPGTAWLDFSYAGTETGSSQQPWNTAAEALTHAPAGGTLFIKAGVSTQTLLSSNYRSTLVTLKAWNGTVRIGG